jgi:anaerobic magnesium-protoporphyrin IX monomethyl ester cyclase
LRILYLPNSYSQQRQHEKKANIYPVLMAMEAQKYRNEGHTVYWGMDDVPYGPFGLQDYAYAPHKTFTEPEGLPFLSLPHPDRVFTRAKEYTSGNYKYLPGTHMQVANGCWWGKCTFCVENISGRYSYGSNDSVMGSQELSALGTKPLITDNGQNPNSYEVRSVEDCIAEIEEIKALGFKEVFDDSGTFPTGEWLTTLLKRIKNSLHNYPMYFGCNMRIVDVDYKMMKEANFRMLLFGVESANQQTLDKINKGIRAEDIIPTLKKSSQAGIENHVAAMVGFPFETKEDTLKTVNLVKYLLIKGYAQTAQMSFYTPPKNQPQGNEEYRKYVNKFYEVGFNPEFWYRKIIRIRSMTDFSYLLKGIKEGIKYV